MYIYIYICFNIHYNTKFLFYNKIKGNKILMIFFKFIFVLKIHVFIEFLIQIMIFKL